MDAQTFLNYALVVLYVLFGGDFAASLEGEVDD